MKYMVRIIAILLVSVISVAACEPPLYTGWHITDVQPTLIGFYRVTFQPPDGSIFSEKIRLVDLSEKTVMEDNPVYENERIAVPELNKNADRISLNYTRTKINWNVSNSDGIQLFSKILTISYEGQFYSPLSFISETLNTAYLIYANATSNNTISIQGLMVDLSTLDSTGFIQNEYDSHSISSTRVYESANVVFITVPCCICYSGVYYKISDTGLTPITSDFEKSVIIQDGSDEMVAFGNRDYLVESWDLDTMKYDNWTITEDQITSNEIAGIDLSYILTLSFLTLTIFVKRNNSKDKYKQK